MEKKRIFLDDVRTPLDTEWVVVRDYDQFVKTVTDIGINNISIISLDHDLGDTAMAEYYNNALPNYKIDYNNITEKTGYDCIKWIIDYYIENRRQIPDSSIDGLTVDDEKQEFIFPEVYSHSANPIGAHNIIGYMNNFLKNFHQPQTSIRVDIPHIIDPQFFMGPEVRKAKWKK